MDRAHEQLLDRNYRYQRHVYDWTREYYLLGRDRLIAGLAMPEHGALLEVGCGTARNLIRIANRYPRCNLYGVDLSTLMLETAQQHLARRGLRGRVLLGQADATSFEPAGLFDCARFDCIVFSYTLSMIPAWQQALAQAADILTPGGSIHVVDFGTGVQLPEHFNALLRGWLLQFHVTPRDDLATVMRNIADSANAALTVTPLFRSYATYAVLTKY